MGAWIHIPPTPSVTWVWQHAHGTLVLKGREGWISATAKSMVFRFSERVCLKNKVKNDRGTHLILNCDLYIHTQTCGMWHPQTYNIPYAHNTTKRITAYWKEGQHSFLLPIYRGCKPHKRRFGVSLQGISFILTPSLTTSLVLTEAVTLYVPLHISFAVCRWCWLLRSYPQHAPSSHTMGYPVWMMNGSAWCWMKVTTGSTLNSYCLSLWLHTNASRRNFYLCSQSSPLPGTK